MMKLVIFAVLLTGVTSFSDFRDGQYKLDKITKPNHYNLDLQIEDFNKFSGNVEIEFKSLKAVNNVELNCKDLNVNFETATLTDDKGNTVLIDTGHLNNTDEKCTIALKDKLNIGQIYTISIKFSGKIRADLKGLYRSSYKVDGKTRYMVTTHFQSTYARMVFPCFDEPEYKSHFDLSIHHAKEFHALSNMPIDELTQNDPFITTKFRTTPLMSTYLLAFIISDYSTLADESDKFRVFAPGNVVNQTVYATDFLKKAVVYLEDFLGQEYQLPKIDLVAIDDFNMGAMENWGLLTFKSTYLLFDELTTTARMKQNIAKLICHEVSHMWFGNEVTPEWWTYLWLSEGIARYLEYYITSDIENAWHFWDQFPTSNLQSALSQDDKTDNRIMSYYTEVPDELNALFDYVVYAKSASVIRMIQNVVGMENFKKALNDYIGKRSYGTSNPDHLFESIDKFNDNYLPVTIKQFIESWSENPGYPIVDVILDPTGKVVTISQKRFWMPVIDSLVPTEKVYIIPINYATSMQPSFEDTSASAWVTDNHNLSIDFDSKINWILVNKQQTGYYRVNYDIENWNKLIDKLQSETYEQIHRLNRAQLVDDSANLAQAGILDYQITLDLMTFLEKEEEYPVWTTAINALNYLIRMLRGTADYSRFEHFIRTITTHMFETVGLEGPNDHISRLHRGNTLYLACYSGVKACVNESQSYVQQMIDNSSYVAPLEIQASIFCTAAKYEVNVEGDIMKVLFDKFIKGREESIELIYEIITGLGCSRNETMIEGLLQLTLAPLPLLGVGLTPKDRNHIFLSVISGSYKGLKMGLEFILENYISMNQRYDSMSQVFESLGARINNRELLKLLEELLAKYESTISSDNLKAAEKAHKIGCQNVMWAIHNVPNITQWLIDGDYDITPEGGGASSVFVHSMTIVTFILVLIIK